MKRILTAALLLFVLSWQTQPCQACTNFLLSRGATSDGSTMITYAADSHTRYG